MHLPALHLTYRMLKRYVVLLRWTSQVNPNPPPVVAIFFNHVTFSKKMHTPHGETNGPFSIRREGIEEAIYFWLQRKNQETSYPVFRGKISDQ